MSLHAQFAVLLLFAAVPPLRAATLRGLILDNELGGDPLSSVEVSAVAGANASASDDQGRFSLEFACSARLAPRRGGPTPPPSRTSFSATPWGGVLEHPSFNFIGTEFIFKRPRGRAGGAGDPSPLGQAEPAQALAGSGHDAE